MEIYSKEKQREFLDCHLRHRLTVLLSWRRRIESDPTFFKGKDDVRRASLEGSFIMTRVFIEFLGVESQRKSDQVLLLQRTRTKATEGQKKARATDVMIDCFGLDLGLDLVRPDDFQENRDLIARVHDGVSKATGHFTYCPGGLFCVERDLIPAIDCIMNKLQRHFFTPLGETPRFDPDLPDVNLRPQKSPPR